MVRSVRKSLAVVFLVAIAPPAAAGPISVFTQVWDSHPGRGDEIPVSGIGSFAVLTTGGGVTPLLTVPTTQTSGSQAVVGFWPVVQFRDQAQYEAERGTVATVLDTSVRLYAEVWHGGYGGPNAQVERVFIDTTVSAQVGTEPGQTVVNWQTPTTPTEVRFGDTVVSLSYVPVRQPDRVPQISFEDGSPPIGFPGPVYYPTLLEAHIDIVWGTEPEPEPLPTGPGGGNGGGGGVPGAPEPTSALLLAGFAVGGIMARRVRDRTVRSASRRG